MAVSKKKVAPKVKAAESPEPSNSLDYINRILPDGVGARADGRDLVFRWHIHNLDREYRIRMNEPQRWANQDRALIDGYYALFWGEYQRIARNK